MRILALVVACYCTFSSWAAFPHAASEEETLFIRRIFEFWSDKDYAFAKQEMAHFLETYPSSAYQERFYAMLGDVAMHENDFVLALDYYERITNYELCSSVRNKRWQALYQLQKFNDLYQETKVLRDYLDDEGRFYLAEAAFREALTLFETGTGEVTARSLCEEALPIYLSLKTHPRMGAHAQLALGEIYHCIGQYREAAQTYLNLAESQPEDENILFHAASMLTHFDPLRAAEIFEQLAKAGVERGSEATFQWLQILAKEEKWELIAQERNLLTARLKGEPLLIAHFYLGMIAHERGDHPQALIDLNKCLDGAINKPAALRALLRSAQILGKTEAIDKTAEWATKELPDLLPYMALMKALSYKADEDPTQAEALLDQLIERYPHTNEAEQAIIEKIGLYLDTQEWEKAHAAVKNILETQPHSPRRSEFLRLAVDLSLKNIDQTTGYEQLTDDLERALEENVFSQNAIEEHQRTLAKAYIKIGQIQKALALIHSFEECDDYLLVQCHIKEDISPGRVIFHGERALNAGYEQERLHLHLFNAYLALSEVQEDEALFEKAAFHLNKVIDHFPISSENRLWLAYFYARRNNPRCIAMLEELFVCEEDYHRYHEESVVLAELYIRFDRLEEARRLLDTCITLKIPSSQRCELELAKVYQLLEETEASRSLYTKLAEITDQPIAHAARLAMARTYFEESPETHLQTLQELKIRKNLLSEPVHLEAALEYAERSSEMVPKKKRHETFLAHLLETKREFTQQNDLWSKDYHAHREQLPEKELIYQAYMRYIDACIYATQAALTYDLDEKRAKQQAAQSIYSSLCQGKYAVTSYIVEKASEGLHVH